MFKGLLKTVFGDPNQKEIDKFSPLVEEVNDLETEFQALSDDEISQIIKIRF